MAGYADDWSMSNNALDAYARGLRPRSKWTKADILDALPADARAYLKLDQYPLEFLREYFLYPEEWHHTSKLYNETEFYRPRINSIDDTPEDVHDLYLYWLQRQQKAQAAKAAAPRKVRVTYTHWIEHRTESGNWSRRQHQKTRRILEPAQVRYLVKNPLPGEKRRHLRDTPLPTRTVLEHDEHTRIVATIEYHHYTNAT